MDVSGRDTLGQDRGEAHWGKEVFPGAGAGWSVLALRGMMPDVFRVRMKDGRDGHKLAPYIRQLDKS